MANLRVSVIVCCHNSGTRLEPTLKHLAAQSGIARDRWEIVLVDNASTDGTAARALDLWQTSGAPADLRIITEQKLGLIHARIAGISESRHEILTFVDDDNWVSPRWCATVIDLMAAHPEVGVIGGRAEAVFESGQRVPTWFAALRHGYAVGPQQLHSGMIEAPMPRFYGAGLTVRRDALTSLLASGFSPLCTGRAGERLAAGEDTELCYALAMSGWRFWYEDSLPLSHFIPAARLEVQYARNLFHGLGVTSALEDCYLRLAAKHMSLIERLKFVGPVSYANVLRNLLRDELRSLWAPPGSAERAEAQIVVSFFKGRLEGMRDCHRNSLSIAAHIAGWASKRAA